VIGGWRVTYFQTYIHTTRSIKSSQKDVGQTSKKQAPTLEVQEAEQFLFNCTRESSTWINPRSGEELFQLHWTSPVPPHPGQQATPLSFVRDMMFVTMMLIVMVITMLTKKKMTIIIMMMKHDNCLEHNIHHPPQLVQE
jgi:hypothetical protein